MQDDDIRALARAAAARLRPLQALSSEEAQSFCLAAQSAVATTIAATGELFSPDPLGPELSRSDRGAIASATAEHAIVFQFDAEGHLITSWNRSRFFRHTPSALGHGAAIDELRVRRGPTFKVGVAASYVLGDDGAVSEWASVNAEGKRVACRYERDADRRIARVVRAASDWEGPESYRVSYAAAGREEGLQDTEPAQIVSEQTGAVLYDASARWSVELLADFTRFLVDDATRAIRAADEPLYCLAIGYDLTWSSGCCPPQLLGGPERVRAHPRLAGSELYSPYAFGAPEHEPIAFPLSPRLLEAASRLRLAIRDEPQLRQLASAYVEVARTLNDARPWATDGAREMPEHFVVFATDMANGDHAKDLERCVTPAQRAVLVRAGLV